MSFKSTVLSVATTLTLVGGVAAATLPAGPAGAATRPCGQGCVDIFSRDTGVHHHLKLALDVLDQAGKVGQPIMLYRASHLDPGEDFTVSFQARVSDFYAAGLVSTWLALRYGGLGCEKYRSATTTCLKHYPDDYAYEIEYAPLGASSGLCVGLPAAVGNGTPVSLQSCGVSARTIWVVDVASGTRSSLFRHYAPLINGSQGGGPHLYVLSNPGGSRQLTTRPLETCGCQGMPLTSQQWGADFGVLGKAP
jgi:hypothetical protein